MTGDGSPGNSGPAVAAVETDAPGRDSFQPRIEAVPAGLLSPLAFALVGCREAFRTTQEDEPWARDASVAASS